MITKNIRWDPLGFCDEGDNNISPVFTTSGSYQVSFGLSKIEYRTNVSGNFKPEYILLFFK